MRSRVACVSVLVVFAGVAAGQNALDKPLDRNQQIGSGGRNPPGPDLAQELRFRNAVVTGNAPGGFSFRGDVGYRAPGEFFGSLGSNETFSFRRDSYYSGLGGMGIRGTDALQYQFAMTTGNSPPPGLSGSATFLRSGADVTARAMQNRETDAPGEGGIHRPMPDPFVPGADLRGMSLMSIRSPSTYVANRGLEPVTLERTLAPDGSVMGLTASPLRGLTYQQFSKPPGEQAKAADTPPGSNRINESAGGAAERTETKVDTKINANEGLRRTAYDDLMDRIRGGGERPEGVESAQEAGALPEWQKELEELRAQLGGARSAQRGTSRTAEARTPGGPTTGAKDKPSEELRPSTIERIRDAGAEVERLAPEGFDAFASHMQAAQDHIAAGRFFYAEERFAAALGVKGGEPMAAIGRVHAQLGAGMFLSAAINLKSLFAEHPEVVTLKYKAELMPSAERRATLIERLEEMTKVADERRRDSGLLLAYLAFQSGNEGAMKRGLEAMSTPDAAPGAPGATQDSMQRLATLLSRLWVEGRPAVTPPASAPRGADPGK